jgi:4-hydroxybenzoate polyprenyltransferase
MADIFFGLALVLIGTAGWMAGAGVIYFTGVAGAALHAAWQMSLLDIDDSGRCLKLFRSNRDFGLIIFIAAVLDSVFRVSI